MVKRKWLLPWQPVLSGVGLAFACGAPATGRFTAIKKWWIVLWAGIFGFYLWSVFLASVTVVSIRAFFPLVIVNAISTASTAMIYLHIRDKWRLNQRKSGIICSLVFIVVLLSGLLALMSNYPSARYFAIVSAAISGQFFSWVFFVLLALNYRKQHMATTLQPSAEQSRM